MVLITANNKLYGDIIPKICQLFYEQAKTSTADLAVIGKQGKNFIDNSGLGKNYQYFELPDTNVQLTQLKPITETFIQYDKVTVFHGKFNNMVSQEAVEAYVSGDIPQDDNTEKTKQRFIFEPSVTNILEFFENQIFSLLLSQTVQEAQLARFGSRIKAMELAQENMQKWLRTLLQKEQRIKNITQNKKQMELFAGRALWRKR
jgi:F0F1-type ATP synthase gamma subunit